MKGDAKVIQYLNTVLGNELVAINQYYLHAKMYQDWGLAALGKWEYEESIEEMKHADRVIERILFLEGIPNMQRLEAVRAGENPVEQHRLDLEVEIRAQKFLNEAIALAREQADNGSRELLEEILTNEEESIDWLEAQLHIVEEIGASAYLAEQIHD